MTPDQQARITNAEENLKRHGLELSPEDRVKALLGMPVIRIIPDDGTPWGIEATTGVASQEGAGKTAAENIMKAYMLYTRRDQPQE